MSTGRTTSFIELTLSELNPLEERLEAKFSPRLLIRPLD